MSGPWVEHPGWGTQARDPKAIHAEQGAHGMEVGARRGPGPAQPQSCLLVEEGGAGVGT